MKLLSCATLLAFVLMVPAAEAQKRRDTTPPTTPTGLRVVSVTEDSVTIAWNASTDNSGKIHAYIAGGIYHPGNSTVKTFTGLVPNWTVTYRVSAMDPSGNESGLSAPLTVTTARDVTAPTTPSGLRVTATTPSSVSLAWTRSTDRWAVWYEVLMDGEVVATAGSTSARVRHIRPGTHVFTVRARDVGGNISPVSNAVTVVLADTGDVTPPAAPTGLTAVEFPDFCGTVELTWGKSEGAVEYEIFRDGRLFELRGDVAKAFVYAPDGPSTWTVVAVDAAGNSSPPSNAVTLSVVADPNLC